MATGPIAIFGRKVIRHGVLIALLLGLGTVDARAGSVRLWPTAVVVDGDIRLGDVSDLRGFDPAEQRQLAKLVIAEAPKPGGSRFVHMEMIRSALAASGTNMATVTISGAMQCAVTRPSHTVASQASPSTALAPSAGSTASGTAASQGATLRQAVIDHFNGQLARYGGEAEVVFDRTSRKVLDLSGPAFAFQVRRRRGPALGLIQLEVDVLSQGKVVQRVPIVVQVALIRHPVVARRSINQGATIRPSDVERVRLTFTRLDNLGIDEVAEVVGERAKRFITAGKMIEPGLLEAIPLVTRGQLVTLTSVVGQVQVVTTAKAMQSGLFGETITVRTANRKRVEFDAVVVGLGAVRIQAASGLPTKTAVAEVNPS